MLKLPRPRLLCSRSLPLALASLAALSAAPADFTFNESQAFLKKYCFACHTDTAAAGGFKVSRVGAPTSLRSDAHRWTTLASRVKNGEMPPKGAPAPAMDLRERFTDWVDMAVRKEVCSAGVQAGPSLLRRLNRDEYAATIRDLLDIHLDMGTMLPADGSGGEGFDNAAETLFLSPLHTEKYLEAAKFAMDFAAKEYKSRSKILIAVPSANLSAPKAAHQVFANFLPKAFRRPVDEADIAPYMTLYAAARKQGQSYEQAIFFALRAALVSPMFLFHNEPPNTASEPRPLDQFSLANRLSYFLWGSMPDELLFDVAAAGKLHEPAVLRELIGRMIRQPDRSMVFAQRFTEQWLRTRELSGDKAPDAKLFPTYASDEELRGDLRFEPIMFFRELLVRDLSIMELLDSKYAIGSSNLEKHYGITMPLDKGRRKQPQWVELPEGSRRGGLLGMGAVLAVSSYPYRTSPVLRGAWILDSILGTPPPPPPPNVPPLDEAHNPSAAKTVRERLEAHRSNAVCASCHSRIDAWGFALENYDAIGRWRDQDSGKPIDASGELLDGSKFTGPAELRKVLLDRKDLFARNLTAKMLGYALGRGLTLQDSCTVDAIVAKLKENDYKARTLIEEIVLSVPFRYQTGIAPAAKPTSANPEKKPAAGKAVATARRGSKP
jgi:hypothetical protein